MDWKLVVDLAQAGAAVFGGLSAGFAGWTIWKSSNERKNSHLLSYSKTTLERAFATLCDGVAAGYHPPANRVAWIASARLIEEYKKAKERIKDPLTLEECESHETHWRHQLYVRLDPLSKTVPEYYGPPRGNDSIPPWAAIIVHNFAMWPDDKPDPLDALELAVRTPNEWDTHLKWQALREYIRIFNQH